jgi:hypothetical protein
MLWAYFDESGQHDPNTGHLVRLTIGGLVAPDDAWRSFEIEWKAALDEAALTAFHMTDFERYEGEFRGWAEDRHREFLNRLLEIIAWHAKDCIGFSNTVFNPKKQFRETYENGLIDSLMHLALRSNRGHADKVSVVFARHKSYGESNIRKIFHFMDQYRDNRLGSLSVDDPASKLPLQAADIVAYEIQRLQRYFIKNNRRYPMRRLEELGCHFRISSEVSVFR